MAKIVIEIPAAVLYGTNMNLAETTSFARKALAMEYYTQKELSLGYCAEIAGLSQFEFIQYLGKHNISIFQFDDLEEFQREVAVAKNE